MRRFLFPLLAALALPTSVNADYGNNEIMIHRFCTTRVRKGIQTYRDCLKEYDPRNSQTFTYKGKTYKPSKTCPSDKRFYWNVEKGFLKKEKVVEVGCLSDYELQSLKNQARNKAGGTGWKGNNQAEINRMRIQTNEYKKYLNDYSKDMGW